MEHEYNYKEETYEYLHYYKNTEEGNNELCQICKLDEFEKHNTLWNRHELVCGHKFHTRCLRRYHKLLNRLHCPACGDLDENKSYYCENCKKFGKRCIHGFYFLYFNSNYRRCKYGTEYASCNLCGKDARFARQCAKDINNKSIIKVFRFCEECNERMEYDTYVDFFYNGDIWENNGGRWDFTK